MRAARGIGNVAWWVFVVAALFTQFGGSRLLHTRRYADYLPDNDYGWMAYTPLRDRAYLSIEPHFTEVDGIAVVAYVALGFAVIAAVAQAVLGRRWLTGFVTVATVVIGALLVLFAVFEDIFDIEFRPSVALAVVLAGVAIREVWSRRFAPRPPPQ